MEKHHMATFKAHLVRELLRADTTISRIAAEHGIHPNQVSKWKAIALQGLPSLYDRADGGDDHVAAEPRREQQTGWWARRAYAIRPYAST